MSTASVPARDMWHLLLSAIRYAMGRATYIVGDTCEMVTRYQASLTVQQLRQIRKEVSTELERATDAGRFLGHECDHTRWEALVRDLDEHITSRSGE